MPAEAEVGDGCSVFVTPVSPTGGSTGTSHGSSPTQGQYTFSREEVGPGFYFTTKRLHEQYMGSSGHNRWIYCPLVPEGIIKISVMPAGMKFRFSHELLHQF